MLDWTGWTHPPPPFWYPCPHPPIPRWKQLSSFLIQVLPVSLVVFILLQFILCSHSECKYHRFHVFIFSSDINALQLFLFVGSRGARCCPVECFGQFMDPCNNLRKQCCPEFPKCNCRECPRSPCPSDSSCEEPCYRTSAKEFRTPPVLVYRWEFTRCVPWMEHARIRVFGTILCINDAMLVYKVLIFCSIAYRYVHHRSDNSFTSFPTTCSFQQVSPNLTSAGEPKSYVRRWALISHTRLLFIWTYLWQIFSHTSH